MGLTGGTRGDICSDTHVATADRTRRRLPRVDRPSRPPRRPPCVAHGVHRPPRRARRDGHGRRHAHREDLVARHRPRVVPHPLRQHPLRRPGPLDRSHVDRAAGAGGCLRPRSVRDEPAIVDPGRAGRRATAGRDRGLVLHPPPRCPWARDLRGPRAAGRRPDPRCPRRARLGLDQLRRRGRTRRTALVVGTQRGVEGFVQQVDARPTSRRGRRRTLDPRQRGAQARCISDAEERLRHRAAERQRGDVTQRQRGGGVGCHPRRPGDDRGRRQATPARRCARPYGGRVGDHHRGPRPG